MRLQTDITIRPYTMEDIPEAYEAIVASVKEIQPFLPWCHPGYTLHELRTWVETQIVQFQAGNVFEVVIVANEGRLVGGWVWTE